MNIPYEELDDIALKNLLKKHQTNLGRLADQLTELGPLNGPTSLINEIGRTNEEITKIRAELTARGHFAISGKVAVQTANDWSTKSSIGNPHPLLSFKTLRRIFLVLLILVISGVGGFLLLTRQETDAHDSFKGAIINSGDNKPVTGAIVSVTVGASAPITAISDDEGRYSFKLDSVGTSVQARIVVNKEGFSPYDQLVSITASQLELQQIELEPRAQTLSFPVTGSGSALDHPISLERYANQATQENIPHFPIGNRTFGKDQVWFKIPEGENRIDTQCERYLTRPTSINVQTDPLTDLSAVYFLINAGFTVDQQGKEIGKIKLIFSDGEEVSTSLFLGWNIREWRVSAENQKLNVVTTISSPDIEQVYPEPTTPEPQEVVDLLTVTVPEDYSNKVLKAIAMEDSSRTADPCFLVAGITVRTTK